MGATRYFSEFANIDGEQWRINIVDSEYAGTSPFEFTVGGYGFELEYSASINDPFQAVIPSSLRFEFIIQNSNDEALLTNLASSEEGRYTVTVIDANSDLWWSGTIVADQVSVVDEAYPQRCEIRATDDLGILKEIEFKSGSVGYGGFAELQAHLWQALSKVRHWSNLNWNDDMLLWSNNLVAADTISSALDMLSNVALHHSTWYDYEDGTVVGFASAYDVLNDIATAFNARVFQYKGKMYFVPVGCYADFTTSSSSLSLYAVDGYGNVSASASSLDVGLHAGSDVFRLRGNALTFMPPFRRVEKTWNARGATSYLTLRAYLNPNASFAWQEAFQEVDDGGVLYAEDTVIRLGYYCRYLPDSDTTQATEGVPFLRFVIQCGDLYCTNSLSASGATFSITGAAWGATTGYFYAPLRQIYAPTVAFGITNEIEFSNVIDLPALTAQEQTLTVTPAIVGFEDDISTSLDNFSNTNAFAFLRCQFFKEQEEIGNATALTYYATVSETSGAQTYSQETRIGSAGNAGTHGQLVTNNAGDKDPLNNWDSLVDSSLSTSNILGLGANEIIALIRHALEVREGELFGEFVSPLNWIEVNGDGYLVCESQFSAYSKQSRFTAFKIQKDLSGITVPSDADGVFGIDPLDTISPSQDEGVVDLNEVVIDHENVVKHLTVTQAVNLDTLETQTNTNTTSISGITDILAVVKATFQAKSDGSNTVTKVVYDEGKTDGLEMSLTQTTAAFTSNSGNTVLSVTESSPGVFDVLLQDDTTNSVRAIYATASGNTPFVGINTNSPSYQLDVNGRVNTSNAYFVNGSALNLNNLANVNVTGATSGQVFQFNGSNWVAATISTGGLSNVVEDTSPQLGGDLDAQSYDVDISGGGALISGGDQYVFKYLTTNYGLFFNLTSPGFEFRTASGAAIFRIAAGTGELTIGTGTASYTLPIDRGSAGEVLQSDGAGNVDFNALDTDDVAEGSNLYFTNARADARIALAELSDLSNVNATAPTNGQVLTWDNSAGEWTAQDGSSGGGASDSFNTIAVSGQSDVVADSGNDTLTFAAGSNIVLTTNATTDTVTFATSSTPTFTSLLTTGAIAALGTISSQTNMSAGGSFSATGNATFGGDATVSGNLFTSNLQFIANGTSVIGVSAVAGNAPDDLEIRSNGNVVIVLDYDDDESAQAFEVKSGDGTSIFKVDEDGVTSGLLTTATPTTTGLSSSYQQGASIAATISNFDSATTYVGKIYNSSGVEQTANPVTVDSSGNISATAPSTIATGYELRVFAAAAGKLRSVESVDTFEVTASRTFTFWRMQGCDASGTNSASKLGVIEMNYWTATGGTGTKYPTTAATSNTSISGVTISAGHQYSSSYASWEAFDRSGSNDGYNDNSGSMWWTLGNSNANNSWIQLEFSSAQTFQSVTVHVYRSFSDATHVKILGSNTGAFAGEEIECVIFALDGSATGAGATFTANL